jgi:hypothetical protein
MIPRASEGRTSPPRPSGYFVPIEKRSRRDSHVLDRCAERVEFQLVPGSRLDDGHFPGQLVETQRRRVAAKRMERPVVLLEGGRFREGPESRHGVRELSHETGEKAPVEDLVAAGPNEARGEIERRRRARLGGRGLVLRAKARPGAARSPRRDPDDERLVRTSRCAFEKVVALVLERARGERP